MRDSVRTTAGSSRGATTLFLIEIFNSLKSTISGEMISSDQPKQAIIKSIYSRFHTRAGVRTGAKERFTGVMLT